MVSQKSQSSAKKPPPTKPKPINNNGNNNNQASEKEPLQVFCRLRPLKNINDRIVINKIDEQHLELQSPSTASKQIYKFQKIFDHTVDQHQIFKQTTYQLLKDLFKGQNGLLFSYGVTSSGKTYTITGTPKNPGIIPRSLDTIFNTLNKNDLQHIRYGFKSNQQNGFEIVSTPDAMLQMQNDRENKQNNIYSTVNRTPRKRNNNNNNNNENDEQNEWINRAQEEMFINDVDCDYKYSIFISYIEVYNNYIYDLLDDEQVNSNNNDMNTIKYSKRIVEDQNKRYYVQGCKEVEVKSSQEAFETCLKGMKRRHIGMTKMNSESSRSHSIFNVRLVRAPLDEDGVEVLNDNSLIRISQISIVDLAGCERQSRTNATGNRLREASKINNSLLTLRQCFDILRENQRILASTTANNAALKMVPYRENKLTHMFKNYFEGDGKVEMIICINPGSDDYDETLQVCKFGELSQDLSTNRYNQFANNPLSPSMLFKSSRFNIQTSITGNNLKNMPISASITATSFKILPLLPKKCILDNESDDETLKLWINALEKRKENYKENEQIIQQYQQNVRQIIYELDRSNTLVEQRNSVLQMDLQARENQLRECENKFMHLEQEYEQRMIQMSKHIEELQQELSTVNHQLMTAKIEKSNIRKEFREYKQSIKKEWDSEFKRLQKYFIEKIHEAESEMEKKMATNKEKLELVRSIINNELNLETLRPSWMSPLKQSSDNEPAIDDEFEIIKSPPVINPGHKRSLSSGDLKWIDHRPPGTLNLGTVFQPNIPSKNKKSVTNLKTADFVGKSSEIASKYAITHHTALNNGTTIETKVFKGDVIPSITGGSQVIFNDVEKLVQIPCTSSPSDQANVAMRQNRKRLIDMFERQNGGGGSPLLPSLSSPSTLTSSNTSSPSKYRNTNNNNNMNMNTLMAKRKKL